MSIKFVVTEATAKDLGLDNAAISDHAVKRFRERLKIYKGVSDQECGERLRMVMLKGARRGSLLVDPVNQNAHIHYLGCQFVVDLANPRRVAIVKTFMVSGDAKPGQLKKVVGNLPASKGANAKPKSRDLRNERDEIVRRKKQRRY